MSPAPGSPAALLSDDLRALMVCRGLTVADVAHRAAVRVSHAELHRLLNGEPAGGPVLEVFLLACGLGADQRRDYLTRYERVLGGAGVPRPAAGPAGPPPTVRAERPSRARRRVAVALLAAVLVGAGVWAGLPLLRPAAGRVSLPVVVVNSAAGPQCSILGDGPVGTCNRQSVADLQLEHERVPAVYFDGPPGELPGAPPAFTATGNQCGQWLDWLRRDPRVFFADLSQRLRLRAGSPDFVVVESLAVETVGPARELGGGIWIRCGTGGDVPAGHQVRCDAAGSPAVVRRREEAGYGPWVPLAGRPVPLDGVRGTDAALSVQSAPGKLYTGFATVGLRLGQRSLTVPIGSAREPYRWIGGGAALLPDASEMYFYDQRRHAWLRGAG